MEEIEEIIVLYNTVNNFISKQTFNDVTIFFHDITKNTPISLAIQETLNNISDDGILKFINALKYIKAMVRNMDAFTVNFIASCNSNMGFDVVVGLFLTEEQLYNCLVKSTYNYFKNELDKKIEMSNNTDEIISELLISYVDEHNSYVNNRPKDISVVKEETEIIITKELQKLCDKYVISTKKTHYLKKFINKRILERKTWAKFNIDDEHSSEIQNIPLKIKVKNDDNKTNENNTTITNNISNDTTHISTTRSQLRCRNCEAVNDHFTINCPKPKNEILESNNSNYQEKKRYHSIKVSNVPEYYDEDDIRDVFSSIGRIYRVVRPQNFSSGGNSDFCYINLDSEESVIRAIKRFNNTKMGNCIIQVTDASR